jgi:hypothetical protein
MEREGLGTLDEGSDDHVDINGVGCCSMIYLPFRS